jgi:hypothetical protein
MDDDVAAALDDLRKRLEAASNVIRPLMRPDALAVLRLLKISDFGCSTGTSVGLVHLGICRSARTCVPGKSSRGSTDRTADLHS